MRKTQAGGHLPSFLFPIVKYLDLQKKYAHLLEAVYMFSIILECLVTSVITVSLIFQRKKN